MLAAAALTIEGHLYDVAQYVAAAAIGWILGDVAVPGWTAIATRSRL